MQSIQERLGNLNVPTQIIWGEEDGVFPEMISDFWQAFYPHSELHTVPRAGHYIQEDAPQEVVALIRDFLGRTP